MKKRIVVLDRDACQFNKCNYACMKACPINRAGKECVRIGEDRYPIFNEELCIGCGLCVKACEKANFNAITLVNIPEALNEDPVHRYGTNGFSLYRLPIPQKNKVIGIIGANGIGKSTILKILSGIIMPNLGKERAEWKEILRRFRGSELQSYLEKLSKKGVRVAYKPQNIDLIPNVWKRKRVRDLLNKIGGDYEYFINTFGINAVLNKNISELSGGELQLVAIVATLIKDAELYFFDEPSSYLDVKSRLLVAKEIRKLSKRSMVMVVEHDLAILDYLSDGIHIIYGKPGAFGIVSHPYGVGTGINTYLHGYIKDENVRIREKPIVFSDVAKSAGSFKKYFEFPQLEKHFENFSLIAEGGSINRGEIIGILGPNGTGKTTFIKMLAGIIKPDKGVIKSELKISFKPQRLVLNAKDASKSVKEYLYEKLKDRAYDTEFKRILRALSIERNLEKDVSFLSGGELQSLFIAESIGKEHDILFLDEPSAFLDVDQRLYMAKIVRDHIKRNGKACFIVDHDLQVIDAMSDRIILFEGVPGVRGHAHAKLTLQEGMNLFLKGLGITFRRDKITKRPRANKEGSIKDREQKKSGNYYYTK
ncbi:MAG TPA: ribosome biogenesis/translation initiation ATPase RLI [Candidatus Aenigmarchaeota archaeon]|nr:MAG: ribosome biogenesis/translation initiation ATPase RLI [Candidatus Aenigmarchaeota archaeon]HDD46415.1 ribosome biogenesis/translation initiation ATPase RLI [Candidatus Aenigmarchaeota archaeon]